MARVVMSSSEMPPAAGGYAQAQYLSMLGYDRIYGRIFVFAPIVGVAVAIGIAFAGILPGVFEWILFAAIYAVTMIGIEIGYHRCFAHRAFQAHPLLESALAIAGTMAWSGSLPWWVATHRRHHRFVDGEGDPHTPNRDRSSASSSLRSFLYGYIGWLLDPPNKYPIGWQEFSKDLYKNPRIFLIYINHLKIVAVSAIVPAVLGAAYHGSALGALMGLLWGCLLPVFVTQHLFMLINSYGHRVGGTPHSGRAIGRSTNSWWLAALSLGQGWHNNHHAMPGAASTSQAWWQIDLGAWLIRLFERMGLATDVRWKMSRPTDKEA